MKCTIILHFQHPHAITNLFRYAEMAKRDIASPTIQILNKLSLFIYQTRKSNSPRQIKGYIFSCPTQENVKQKGLILQHS
jgi:hypothetical protein